MTGPRPHGRTSTRTARLVRPAAGWALTCLLAGAAAGLWPMPGAAQTASGPAVKAAFLVNFAKFVEWPAGDPADRPFLIGVLGDDAVTGALEALVKGKSVAGRPMVARRMATGDNLAELQILFIGDSQAGRVADVLRITNTGQVLTASELDRFCLQGGTIEFVSEQDRMRFAINLNQAERSGLVITSKLLALAKTVYSTKPPGATR